MFRAIIIDDEPDAIRVIKHHIQQLKASPVSVVGEANLLKAGIALIDQLKPDIVFLDIDMPGKNGMHIYEVFPSPFFKVIFTTAYEEYALQAIRNFAAGYLLKPIGFKEFKEVIDNTHANNLPDLNHELKHLLLTHQHSNTGRQLVFEVQNGFVSENTSNIQYCYAAQSYAILVGNDDQEITLSKNLKELEDVLPDDTFYRTHKSYLVNINYISRFVRLKDNYIVLKSGKKIPVSVRVSHRITRDIKQMLEQ